MLTPAPRPSLHLNILAQYGADSVTDLEARITTGEVAEHPAWENLIVAENLAARLEELNGYLEALQDVTEERAA